VPPSPLLRGHDYREASHRRATGFSVQRRLRPTRPSTASSLTTASPTPCMRQRRRLESGGGSARHNDWVTTIRTTPSSPGHRADRALPVLDLPGRCRSGRPVPPGLRTPAATTSAGSRRCAPSSPDVRGSYPSVSTRRGVPTGLDVPSRRRACRCSSLTTWTGSGSASSVSHELVRTSGFATSLTVVIGATRLNEGFAN